MGPPYHGALIMLPNISLPEGAPKNSQPLANMFRNLI